MRLLDLFCGSGGAAMGYHRAGFEVVGVDIDEMPNYPFAFVRDDALVALRRPFQDSEGKWWDASDFDAIHASPPCFAYSRSTAWRSSRDLHDRMIPQVRDALIETGKPYVIENVGEAWPELIDPVLMCGSMFGLRVRRHRRFELGFPAYWLSPSCHHRPTDFSHDHGLKQSEAEYRDAMGCDWMTVHEARLAIPPAFTQFIGDHLIQHLQQQTLPISV